MRPVCPARGWGSCGDRCAPSQSAARCRSRASRCPTTSGRPWRRGTSSRTRPTTTNWPSPPTPERWTTSGRWLSDPHFRWLGSRRPRPALRRVCLPARQVTGALAHDPDLRSRARPAHGYLPMKAPTRTTFPALMGEVIDWLGSGDLEAHVAVRAAMAHLHVVVRPSVSRRQRAHLPHRPIARARARRAARPRVQLDRGIPGPPHQRLLPRAATKSRAVATSRERDAAPWVRFCVDAHIEQAQQRLAQLAAASDALGGARGLAGRHAAGPTGW